MNYYAFDFLVEKATPAQANEIMNAIIAKVEELGLDMGGGCFPVSDEALEKKAKLEELVELAVNVAESTSAKKSSPSICHGCPEIEVCWSVPSECPNKEVANVKTG